MELTIFCIAIHYVFYGLELVGDVDKVGNVFFNLVISLVCNKAFNIVAYKGECYVCCVEIWIFIQQFHNYILILGKHLKSVFLITKHHRAQCNGTNGANLIFLYIVFSCDIRRHFCIFN